MLQPAHRQQLNERGYCIVENVCSSDWMERLQVEIDKLSLNGLAHSRESVYALRNPVAASHAIADMVHASPIADIASSLFDDAPMIVRSLYFDKPVDANWRVPWHQDRMVALAEKVEEEGFAAWSVKDGVAHAQPPLPILESMATIRIHLDDCDAGNGALHVVPGSHRAGFRSAREILAMRGQVGEEVCSVSRGGVMLMKPLRAHASSPAQHPRHRRVLHLEVADAAPGSGASWHSALSLALAAAD